MPTTTSVTVSAPTSPWSTTATFAIDSGQDAFLGDTSKDRWVVIHAYESSRIAAIRAANSRTKVIAYQEAGATSDGAGGSGTPDSSFGVDYAATKQSWAFDFLRKSTTGLDAIYSDFATYHAMDPAQPDYQSRWATSVRDRLLTYSFDGVMADDANAGGPGHGLNGIVQTYDGVNLTDQQYGESWYGWVGAVVPILRAAGLEFFGNFAGDPWSTTWREPNIERIASVPGSGHLREFWMRFQAGDPVFTDVNWTAMMDQFEHEQANGGRYLALTYGSMADTATMRYARASFLLGWNGWDGAAMAWDCQALQDSHNANWTIEIGRPTEARQAVGVGWMRHFTGGVVVVNPSSTTSQAFTLGGTYTDQDAVSRTSITLTAGTAMVLRTG